MKTTPFILATTLLLASLNAFGATVYEGFDYTAGAFTSSASPTVATNATGLAGNWTWLQNGDANPTTIGIIAPTPFRDMEAGGNALQWHNPTAPGSGAAGSYLYAPLAAAATTALSVADGQSKTLWLSWVMDSSGAGAPTVELRNNSASATGGVVFGVSAVLSPGSYPANTVQLLANNTSLAGASHTFSTGAEYLIVAKLTYSNATGTISFDSGSVWVLENSGTLPADEAGLGTALASFGSPVTTTANRDPSYLRINNNSSIGLNGYDEIRVGTAFSDVVVVSSTPPPPPPLGALIWDTFPASFSNFTVQNTLTADGLSWDPAAGVNGVSGRINAAAGPLTEPNPLYHTNGVIYLGTGAEMTKNTTDTFTASVLFLTNEELLPNIAHATTGFLRSTGSAFNTGAGGCAVWGTVRQTSSGSGAVLRLYRTGGQIGADSDYLILQPNTWYEVETTMQLASDALLDDLTVAVYSRGADGTAARSLVLAMSAASVALPNGGFTGNIWTGFGGGNYQNQNILAFDNFAAGTVVAQDPAVPELSISLSSGNLVISCASESGFQYQLQESTTLDGFTNVDGQLQNGNDGILTFTVPAPAAGARKFHLVEVSPAP